MVKKKTCVFISGKGTNLRNLINRSRDNCFPINISLIITNNRDAYGILFAKINAIPYVVINPKLRNNEKKILKILKKNKISFICLAGYMKIISKNFISNYFNTIHRFRYFRNTIIMIDELIYGLFIWHCYIATKRIVFFT